ncbi:MAG TPA: TonB-dependent receptor [Caulobacteraceae bacterium]|nr:TonB-dependent receptor [Caulobacteraceae bacterium]
MPSSRPGRIGWPCGRLGASAIGGAIGALGLVLPAAAQASEQVPFNLSSLSIEELANIEIYSVAKSAEPLSEAPAAVFVITHDDIVRSGAATVPDMLRLAPNLQVAQITATSFAITARGFNGSASDKLLVLVDGRSVYTPFVSGVFWDAQNVLPEDVERIEVISGPGAALWGANAVNGVINIVTRKASDTQGLLLSGGGGSLERRGAVRYGGKLGPDLAFRVYGMAADHSHDLTGAGADAKDGWSQGQGGFRIDWTPGRDVATLQGDIYKGSEDQPTTPDMSIRGHNLLARWMHTLSASSMLQVQAYYDDIARSVPTVADQSLRTYDLDVQHSFAVGSRQQIVWGGGVRVMRDNFVIVPNNPSSPYNQFFDPVSRTLTLSNVFVQDTVDLKPTLKLILGLKVEDDPYVAAAPLPSVRLSWKVSGDDLLWASVSRAIRAPSRLDRDFFETSGSTVVLKGGNFQAEQLVAYEVGYRGQRSARLSASVSAFYNVYQDLRTFEFSPGGGLPLTIQNRMEGATYGVEVWTSYQAVRWWRLTAGFNWLHENLRFKAGASKLGGISSAGNDPDYQVSLRSTMDLSRSVALDLDLRSIGALPEPASPAYTELNGKLSWAVTDRIELSLVGANLLHARHTEFGQGAASVQLGATGVETGRSLTLNARLRY